MSICGGIAGNRGYNPIGIFLHNDAGSQNANAAFYKGWLPTHNLESGFAHYYVASDGILQTEDDGNMAWHCGQSDGNTKYLSIEICQSEGDELTFRKNEDKAFELAAEKCIQYNITPSSGTIRLHREVYATSCPRRSVSIHGNTVEECRAYFVQRINACIAELKKQEEPERVKKYIVQCGKFEDLETAKKIGNICIGELGQAGTSIQTTQKVVKVEEYTVQVGKFADVEEAKKIGNKLIGKGYKNQTSIMTIEE